MKYCLRTDDFHAPTSVREYCRSILDNIDGLSVTTASIPPDKKRCLTTLYEQQIDGLKSLPDEPIFSVENDVLYHPSRFNFSPLDAAFYYQTNFYNLTSFGYLRHPTGECYSQMVAKNVSWLNNIEARVGAMKDGWKLVWAEPGRKDPPGAKYNKSTYRAEYPDVGVRHGKNYTGDRKVADADLYIDSIPYWGDYRELLSKLGMDKEEKKLNVGSGCMLMPGYINFDVVKVVRGDKSTDVIDEAKNILKHFDLDSFDEIVCCHILEHLRPVDGKKLIQDCYKLLKKGGVLVIECPDILKCIQMWNKKNVTFGEPPSVHKLMTFLYGWRKDQWRDYGYHQYGYTDDTMAELVTSCGFNLSKKCEGRMHGRRARDFRIEGIK